MIIDYEAAARADLVVDATYAGSNDRQQDALPRVLGVGVQGGFRVRGSAPGYQLVALTTSGSEPEWPDYLDTSTGRFTYFGDNRHPGADLHSKLGNRLLRSVFDHIHASPPRRDLVPPFFVFRKPTALEPRQTNRDLTFLGLAVPGGPGVGSDEDLIAAWRTKGGRRFQNYRAIFTILDASPIRRDWISSLIQGTPSLELGPPAWTEWISQGRHRPLAAPERPRFRTDAEQWPAHPEGVAIIRAIRQHFISSQDERRAGYRFEACAAALWKMACGDPISYSVTRPVVDRGRDAVGELLLGPVTDPIPVDFSLEAKLYDFESGVRVTTGDTKRLIARLRYRQFGVLVTTSVVARQAYDEIREDRHPVVIVSAADIVGILGRHGYGDVEAVTSWLAAEFPVE